MNDRRGLAYGMATVVLAATALTAATSDTHAAGPVTSGSGWKLRTTVTHTDTQPWTITFHDATSRTRLTGYLRNNAAELATQLGVNVTVTTNLTPTTTAGCAPSHTITYRWQSKPDPTAPNRSFTTPCTLRAAPYSAKVYINSDYWAAGRRFREYQRLNVIWHETAHAAGLTHPDSCPKDKTGRLPIMCNAESYTSLSTRRYSSFEAAAFKALRTNRAYHPAA